MTDEEILRRAKEMIAEHKHDRDNDDSPWACRAHREGDNCCIDFLAGAAKIWNGSNRVVAKWSDRPTNPDN